MPAILRIDQAGLSAGVPGVARDDGLDTGALVTLTNSGGGATTDVNLLWVPPEDTTALASLVQTGPTTFTFSPTAVVYGRWTIELIADLGLPTESRTVHTFGVALPLSGIVIPAANEIADPTTTKQNETEANRLEASQSNAPFAPFVGRQPYGWWKWIRDVSLAVEKLSIIPCWFFGALDLVTSGTVDGTLTGGGFIDVPIFFQAPAAFRWTGLRLNVLQNTSLTPTTVTLLTGTAGSPVSTSITITFAGGFTGTVEILGENVPLAAGDGFALEITNTNGGTTNNIVLTSSLVS